MVGSLFAALSGTRSSAGAPASLQRGTQRVERLTLQLLVQSHQSELGRVERLKAVEAAVDTLSGGRTRGRQRPRVAQVKRRAERT